MQTGASTVTRRRRPRRTDAAWSAFVRGLAAVAVVAHYGEAQAPDELVAAALRARGLPDDLGEASATRTALLEARLRGQAELARLLLDLASGRALGRPVPAVAIWLSRQHLGHTGEGIDDAVRSRVLALQKMSRAELVRVLRETLAKLEPGESRPGLAVIK